MVARLSSDDDRRPPFYLGIDLGGTNIKAGVVDDAGRPLSFVHAETEAERGPEVGIDNLARVGRRAVEASGLSWDDIAAVGLGSPGTMDIREGLLLDPPNLPGWVNVPIREKLGERLGKPTVLQNDANAAAYGEYWAGAGRDMESVVLFTLGTGIGCGIIDERSDHRGTAQPRRRVRSHHHPDGERAPVLVRPVRAPRSLRLGHLAGEAGHGGAGARAELAAAQALAAKRLSSEAISEAAEAGDLLARRLMRETARYLAVGAVNLMHTIDPDVILFGGGMIAAGPTFLEAIRGDIRRWPSRSPRLEPSSSTPNSGARPASSAPPAVPASPSESRPTDPDEFVREPGPSRVEKGRVGEDREGKPLAGTMRPRARPTLRIVPAGTAAGTLGLARLGA